MWLKSWTKNAGKYSSTCFCINFGGYAVVDQSGFAPRSDPVCGLLIDLSPCFCTYVMNHPEIIHSISYSTRLYTMTRIKSQFCSGELQTKIMLVSQKILKSSPYFLPSSIMNIYQAIFASISHHRELLSGNTIISPFFIHNEHRPCHSYIFVTNVDFVLILGF